MRMRYTPANARMPVRIARLPARPMLTTGNED
jgi:hypothetical protein